MPGFGKGAEPLRRLNVLVVGGPPWSEDINQPATQMAQAFSRDGHAVTYLCRPRQSSRLRGVAGRGRRRKAPSITASGIRVEYLAGVAEALPLTAPVLRLLQRRLLMRTIARAESHYGPYDATLLYWWFFPEIVDRLPGVVLYDAIDEHHAYPINAGRRRHNARTLAWEERTSAAADVVTTVSSAALERLKTTNPSAHLLPNGFDVALFADLQVELDSTAVVSCRVGYAGGVGKRIDWDLVRRLSLARPGYDFVFAGGGERPYDLPDNVRFLGAMRYPDILLTVASAAVTIIPFVNDEFTRGSDFLKAYDYLALGKVVVSTPLPSLVRLGERYPEHILLPKRDEEWLQALDHVIASSGASRDRPDLTAASTDVRARRLASLLADN